jgi:hypothetical protein
MSPTKQDMIMETKTTKKSAFYYHHSNIKGAKQGMCHLVALSFTLKKYLKAKGEL